MTSNQPKLVSAVAELRDAIREAARGRQRIGLVATMGALHRGHVSLAEAAVAECDFTVLTVFVNPMQFGRQEDFARYPRNLEADLARLAHLPIDIVFAPSTDEVYGPGHQTFVEVTNVSQLWEGEARPGHFRGVATVVMKLLNLVTPTVAYFGQKDYQQTLIVRQMVRDLNLDVEIRVCPTVREPDGLALSSRNAYLSAREREQALVLSHSLEVARRLIVAGERDPQAVLRHMSDLFAAEAEVRPEYIALVDTHTLAPLQSIDGPVVALVAAHVGKTRLIDNCLIEV